MKKVEYTQAQLDNHSKAHNPNNGAYAAVMKNRCNQLNPFHDVYYKSRGLEPPDYSKLAQELENVVH